MDVPNRNEPDGGLLKCSSCLRPVELATGGIDEDGYALCESCAGYRRGYRDGQHDAANALAIIVRVAEREALHPDGIADAGRWMAEPKARED